MPTLFNEEQRKTLASVCDTIIAPITNPATIKSIVDAKYKSPGLENVTRKDIEKFLTSSATTTLPTLVSDIEDALQRNMPADVSSELGLLLTAMGTTAGMLALSLSISCASPFYDLPFETRESFLIGLNQSIIGLKRKAFVSLRQLICIKAFGTGPTNPLWRSFGFDGPRKTVDVMRGQENYLEENEEVEREGGVINAGAAASREFDFSPYVVTPKDVADGSSSSSSKYDAIVVGSGCGGSVVCERLAREGFKVLLIEKGKYLCRSEMSGSEDEFDRLYERGGLCVTDDTGLAVLAGSAFGGGTAVNWACCLEPPRYVREE
jgi:hypothetical protein